MRRRMSWFLFKYEIHNFVAFFFFVGIHCILYKDLQDLAYRRLKYVDQQL